MYKHTTAFVEERKMQIIESLISATMNNLVQVSPFVEQITKVNYLGKDFNFIKHLLWSFHPLLSTWIGHSFLFIFNIVFIEFPVLFLHLFCLFCLSVKFAISCIMWHYQNLSFPSKVQNAATLWVTFLCTLVPQSCYQQNN